ncbi:MAG: hypothetical protein LBU43_09755 [Candidatus Accumulibacter sp.]|jgi:hemolysin activation/secretion protein|nr:hypothetical protein [Accumulibacter sp.]
MRQHTHTPIHRANRNGTSRLPTLLVTLLLTAAPGASRAAPDIRVPDSGTAMREAQQARPVVPPSRNETGLTPGQAVPTPPPANAGGAVVFVREFQLENADYLPEAEIQNVLAPYKGRELTLAQLEEAAAAVTKLYRERGYPAARAFLPRQKAEGGSITLRVLVGKYGASGLENKSLVQNWLLDKTINDIIEPGQPVRRADLERTVLLIGDLPGAALPKLNMGAGQEAGTTDFFVQVPEGKRVGGFLISDNQGSRYTGRWRLGGGVDVNSPLGVGDKLSLFGLKTEGGGLSNGAINYSFPLAANGLRLNLGYSHVAYKLGDDYRYLDADGWADTYEGTFSYPVIRSSAQNLYASLNLARKKMHDSYGEFREFEDYGLMRKSSTLAKLGLRYELWNNLAGHPVFTQINGSFTHGKLSLHAGEQRDHDQAGAERRGAFSYANLGIQTQIGLADKWNLSLGASGQKAFGRNLDGSEQLNIAGANGVKAYREAVSGSNAWLLNAELRYALPAPKDGLKHSVAAFADHGGWRYAKHSGRFDPKKDTLSDVGLAYYLNFGGFSAKVQLTHALGSYPEELKKEDRTRLLALFVMSF